MAMPDAQMGREGDEKSGRAIYARQQQGQMATFNFPDNMAKGVRRTYEIILGLIPEVYDTERELRILGTDGAEDYVKVNQVVFDPQEGRSVRVNDMVAGKYDVAITVGPSFSTLRQESAEVYMQLTQGFPQIMGVAGDLIFKSMDLPYADDIAERLKVMLPPQIQQTFDQDKDVPPEVKQMMQQASQAMAQVQEYGQLVQAAAAELEEEKSLDAQAKAEIKTALAELKQAEAEFDARVAEKLADLIKKDAGLSTKEANLVVKGAQVEKAAVDAGTELDTLGDQYDGTSALARAVKVDELLAGHMLVVDKTMGMIEQRLNRKVSGGTVVREGGTLTADVAFDDGSEATMSAVRDGPGLKIVPPKPE